MGFLNSLGYENFARQIGLHPGVFRRGENFGRRAVFDELAQVKKNDVIRDPLGLPEDMSHDDDRIVLL